MEREKCKGKESERNDQRDFAQRAVRANVAAGRSIQTV